MINRNIRTLPLPASSQITNEIIQAIKAIPDDEIKYTQEEIEWLKRALSNLGEMLEIAKGAASETGKINIRISQIKEQLEVALKNIED